MIEGSLSRRYTKALFELAREGHREEAIGADLEGFLAAYTGSQLAAVLNNPAFRSDARKKVLIEVTKSLGLAPLSEHFLALLLERDRLAYLPSIAQRYRRLLNDTRGRVEAKVVGAVALEPEIVARLRQALAAISGKEVVLQEETDPSLIGGALVELEGKIYDGSVRTQLENMKQRIARGY